MGKFLPFTFMKSYLNSEIGQNTLTRFDIKIFQEVKEFLDYYPPTSDKDKDTHIKIKVTASNNGNNATISIITIITYSKHTTNIFILF